MHPPQKKAPLVSVMTLAYNHEETIERTIVSVLDQQTNYPYELVIGEDCSTDKTKEIVRSYQELHPDTIRVVQSDKNVGAKKNSARTLAALRGKYLALCEGDDFWHDPRKLQKQTEFLEANPEYVLTCSDYNEYYIHSKKTVKSYLKNRLNSSIKEDQSISEILSGQNQILTCTTLSRLDLVRQIRSEDPFLHTSGHFKMGDTQLWAELSLKGKIHFSKESLATRTMNHESATRSKDERKVLQFWISNLEMVQYLSEKYNILKDRRELLSYSKAHKELKLAILEDDYVRGLEIAHKLENKRHSDRILIAAMHRPLIRKLTKLILRLKHYYRSRS
ncbi:glycosyltransferase family 2 protein [Pelagicoccus mobilis]|uniref:Glycosyltransferase n=1 Tax=Pelagicoccus mobilis TaxID=415221 RepID=A0A934VQJ2_9BACT|nr:glycosyltransferase [Pelagicoccus mobilis]MBK1876638.1 glycosyltransferase [Pelagicoccus mobilis]